MSKMMFALCVFYILLMLTVIIIQGICIGIEVNEVMPEDIKARLIYTRLSAISLAIGAIFLQLTILK